MKIRVLRSEGGDMERDITQKVKGFMMFLFCAGVIFALLMAWFLFVPSPRLERVKIAMHDEQTFQRLRQKHGKVNTGVVVYEADGKAYFYNRKGEQVILK